MKKVILFLVAYLLGSNSLHAWYVAGNPDRYPSVAVGYHVAHLGGEGTSLERISFLSIPTDVPTENSLDRYDLSAKLILPLNERVSVDLDWGYEVQEFVYAGRAKASDLRGDLRGTSVGGTFRLFFNGSHE